MPTCEVVAVINRIPTEPYYHLQEWLDSLAKFGVKPTVLGLGEHWKGLINIPRYIRKWLREGQCKSPYLIFSNAYDVLFTAHPDEVAEKWGGGDDVMFNCEKDLFPPSRLGHRFPDTGSPWRYLNSGMYIGKPERILDMLESMWLDDIADDHVAYTPLHGSGQVNVVDQNWFQMLYAAQPVPITLDTQCNLFQCFSRCTWDEFELIPGGFRNKITGTQPLIGHFNGGAKNEMLPEMSRHLELRP